jgi:hypothetical protein
MVDGGSLMRGIIGVTLTPISPHELQRSPLKLGVDYYWERFLELRESSNRVQYYLGWYYEWDLLKT